MTSTLEAALKRLADGRPLPEIGATAPLGRSLSAIRNHLGMDVAFISEFVDGRRYFRVVDASTSAPPIQVGQSDPLEHSFCQRVVDGRLPELMVDACLNAEALTLPVTQKLPVGAHLSVPVRLKGGRVFGTLCCFSTRADPSLGQRDLALMRVLSDMLADQIDTDLQDQRADNAIQSRLALAMDAKHMRSVYQPIWNLDTQRLLGFEALTRFDCDQQRPPDQWFHEAAAAGQGTALEIRAIESALQALAQIPDDLYIAINASPLTVISPALSAVLAQHPLHRIVLEVTEHDEVDAALYNQIAQVTHPLRQAGLRVAVDDAGAGYACFKHILHLSPDIIKVDVSITRDIDSDFSRQALASALVNFSKSIRCSLVAEGVETGSELTTLRQLGVQLAQGYALARPMPLEKALLLINKKALLEISSRTASTS